MHCLLESSSDDLSVLDVNVQRFPGFKGCNSGSDLGTPKQSIRTAKIKLLNLQIIQTDTIRLTDPVRTLIHLYSV